MRTPLFPPTEGSKGISNLSTTNIELTNQTTEKVHQIHNYCLHDCAESEIDHLKPTPNNNPNGENIDLYTRSCPSYLSLGFQ